MLVKFVPDMYKKNIFEIDYKKLKKIGIKCIIFDLDNTIAPNNIKVPSKKVKDLIEELKDMNFRVLIVSNSPKQRVEPFKNALNVDSAAFALKPKKDKYLKIMNVYNLKEEEIACIGDQLLTDIFGANRLNLMSILINPISKTDAFTTNINRALERIIMKKLRKKDLFEKGKYYD